MSRKADQLRQRAEELRTNADNIRTEECHRISLELAVMAEELADQWEAIELTMGHLTDRVGKVDFTTARNLSELCRGGLRLPTQGAIGILNSA